MKLNPGKRLYIIFLVASLSLICACTRRKSTDNHSNSDIKKSRPGPELVKETGRTASDSLLIFKEKFVFKSDSAACSFTEEYPRVEYKKNLKAERLMNEVLLKTFRITKFKRTPKDQLCADENSIPAYKVYNYKGKILNVLINHEFFGEGAAHPYYSTSTLNMEIGTGSERDPRRLFDRNKLAALKAALLNSVSRKVDSLFTEGIKPPDIASNIDLNVYMISSRGLTFFIQTGNGAIQEIEVFMPFSEINIFLDTSFKS
ncbi:MAG: hypothetical protein AAGC65_12575 [Mucilaginibacter sp.]|uniref:hypothetical protein n=1 Tax=Mucilaginibacter sp. TaxID=1882438 RepID=UPI0031B385D0